MLSAVLKNLSILKKFLFINSIVFIIIGLGTIFYLKTVQPNLIKKKIANHIQIIDNTINHIQRLNVKFNEEDSQNNSIEVSSSAGKYVIKLNQNRGKYSYIEVTKDGSTRPYESLPLTVKILKSFIAGGGAGLINSSGDELAGGGDSFPNLSYTFGDEDSPQSIRSDEQPGSGESIHSIPSDIYEATSDVAAESDNSTADSTSVTGIDALAPSTPFVPGLIVEASLGFQSYE